MDVERKPYLAAKEFHETAFSRGAGALRSASMHPTRRSRVFAAGFFEDVFGDINGDIGCHSQGDGVAGPAIDFDELTLFADAQLREISVLAEFVDVDVLKIAAEIVDDAGNEIVGQGPGRLLALDATIDAGGLENADDNRKRALTFRLAQHNDVLIVDFINDDAFEFHQDGHGRLAG